MRLTKEEREAVAKSFIVTLEERAKTEARGGSALPYMRGYMESFLASLMYDNPEMMAAVQYHTSELEKKNESV
jgi:hypothetical protein